MEPTFYSDALNRSTPEIGEISPKAIIPRPNLILARRVPPDDRIGNIILPDVARGERGLAIVVAVSEMAKDKCPFKEGDVIIHAQHAGVPVGLKGMDEHLFLTWDAGDMDEVDVLASIEPSAAKPILDFVAVRDKSSSKPDKKKVVDAVVKAS